MNTWDSNDHRLIGRIMGTLGKAILALESIRNSHSLDGYTCGPTMPGGDLDSLIKEARDVIVSAKAQS